MGDDSEEYIDPDHVYPVFPKSVANDQRYEIYQKREGLFDLIDIISSTMSKLNKHMKEHIPHHPATTTRFTNLINSNAKTFGMQYQEYLEILNQHIPGTNDPDPEMQKQYLEYGKIYHIPEVNN